MLKPDTSNYIWTMPLFVALLCTACSSTSDQEPPPPPPPGDAIEVSGTITEDTSWSGIVHMVADTMIPSGVSVTIEPGTWFQATDGTFLRVEGSLTIAGTSAEPVNVYPREGSSSWGGFTAEAGGSVDIRHVTGQHVSSFLYCKRNAAHCRLAFVNFVYLGNAIITEATSSIENSYFEDMANAGISVRAGSDLTITDSYILTSEHDLIVTQGGSRLTIDHSEIGGATGSYEHCNLHLGGADYVSVTNSNLISSIYAIMIGNTTGAVIQYNNIIANDNDILEVGQNSNVDMRYNYWDRGAPNLGVPYDTSNAADAEYAQAGPRS